MAEQIGFIGLGIMGKPMARNLLKAGYSLTVYDIVGSNQEEVVADGATGASSSKEVAAASDTIITMLPDSADSEKVILGPDGVLEGAKSGAVIIDMSSIAPLVSQRIAAVCAQKGVEMLDAPVSGGEPGAVAGTLAVMVGGKQSIFDKGLDLMQVMGGNVVLTGDIGAGGVTKLANQIIGLGNLAAMCEGLVFAIKAGGDPEALLRAWEGGAANSWMVQNMGPRIFNGDFAPGFMVKLAQKDLRLVLESAAEMNVPLFTTPLVNQIFRSAQQAGYGDDGIQAYVKVLEGLAGVQARASKALP